MHNEYNLCTNTEILFNDCDTIIKSYESFIFVALFDTFFFVKTRSYIFTSMFCYPG